MKAKTAVRIAKATKVAAATNPALADALAKVITPPIDIDVAIAAIADALAADFNATLAREHALQDSCPAGLKRARKTAELPVVEDMKVEPVIHTSNKPLALPGDGMNIIEISLHCGSNDETGLRRYLVVSMGTKMAQLLHIPDLEHVEVEVRYINDRVTNGKAHWFAVPPTLGQRLIDKCVQWEMHGMRYSRSLLNDALTNLGMPALPESPALAAAPGTVAHERQTKRAAAKSERGPGVIDTLITLLRNGGGTIDELLASLMTAFPDRDESMRNTIKTQINRLPKQGKLEIKRVGDKYMAADATPTNATANTEFKSNQLAKGALPASNDFQQELIKQKAREEEYSERPVLAPTRRKARK